MAKIVIRRRPRLVEIMAPLVLVWGSTYAVIKVLLRDLDPYAIAAGRILVAAIAFTVAGVVLAKRPHPDRAPGDRWRIIVGGVCALAIHHLALNWGSQFVSAGAASLIMATMPAMVAVVAALSLHEKLDGSRIAGVAVAFAGVGLLTGASGRGLTLSSMAGIGITAIAPAAWCVYTVILKPIAHRYDAVALNVTGAWVSALLLAPFGFRDLEGFARIGLNGWILIIYLGAVSTAMTTLAYSWALRTWPAAGLSSFVYLIPIAGNVWAWMLLGEQPSIWTVTSGAMVVIGLLLIWRSRPVAAWRWVATRTLGRTA